MHGRDRSFPSWTLPRKKNVFSHYAGEAEEKEGREAELFKLSEVTGKGMQLAAGVDTARRLRGRDYRGGEHKARK